MKDVEIQVDLMQPQEVDLGEKRMQKKRVKVDEYDYNDPFIEPFEGEAQAVMIECSLDDFFVYAGELPHSARKALSIYKTKKAREEDTKAASAKKQRLSKNDSRTCEYLASMIHSEQDAGRVETYLRQAMFSCFLEEQGTGETCTASRPSVAEIEEYIRETEPRMNSAFASVSEDVLDSQKYANNFLLFKGFKDTFLTSMCDYFLLFMKIHFLSTSNPSLNDARRAAHSNVLGLFSSTCRNARKIQHYLVKEIERRGVKNMFEKTEDDVSSNLERPEE